MAEILAQLEKKGDGETLLPTTPDALYSNNSLAANATATLAITKKPRWIILVFNCAQISSGRFVVGVIDVKNNAGYRYAFFDNDNHNEVWSGWTAYITSITDTTITIKNSLGYSCFVRVGAYY